MNAEKKKKEEKVVERHTTVRLSEWILKVGGDLTGEPRRAAGINLIFNTFGGREKFLHSTIYKMETYFTFEK